MLLFSETLNFTLRSTKQSDHGISNIMNSLSSLFLSLHQLITQLSPVILTFYTNNNTILFTELASEMVLLKVTNISPFATVKQVCWIRAHIHWYWFMHTQDQQSVHWITLCISKMQDDAYHFIHSESTQMREINSWFTRCFMI